ncbi:MAG: hypothetical protein R2733_17190 [Acidimicrobiales bacterium]
MTRYLGLEEAADPLGVSTKTVRRRVQAREWPGAKKDGNSHSAPWLIPSDELPIPASAGVDVPPKVVELREALLAGEREQTAKELARLVEDLERSGREAQRLRSDVEQERTRADQADREATLQRAAAEIASARAEEREREIGRLIEDRDRRLAELAESRDLEREHAEVEERLRAELADVQSVLGWRARRRLAKLRG